MPLPLEFTFEQLLQAADVRDRGGLTIAGRELHKHGSRSGSAFPPPRGDAAALNRAAHEIVTQMLLDSGGNITRRHHTRHGYIVEVFGTDGKGVRYTAAGRFVNFLEPRQRRIPYET